MSASLSPSASAMQKAVPEYSAFFKNVSVLTMLVLVVTIDCAEMSGSGSAIVGDIVTTVGWDDGTNDGKGVGAALGLGVGKNVGVAEGFGLGLNVGLRVGSPAFTVGLKVGS
jgi:hypothetical protein